VSRRFAFLATTLGTGAASLVLFFVAHALAARGDEHVSQTDARIQPADRVAPHVLRALATEAQHASGPSRVWSRGRVRVLSKVVLGEVWRLAYIEASGRTCFLLLVPRTTQEGTCGLRADISRRQLLIYTGARPSRNDPSRMDGLVVYGLASKAVRSLRLELSDCSTIPVALAARPLFWVFLPREKLAHRVVPTSFVLSLRERRVVHSRLGGTGVASSCSA
jgi:hypothetical protein